MKIKLRILSVFCLGLLQSLLDGTVNRLLGTHGFLAGDLIL